MTSRLQVMYKCDVHPSRYEYEENQRAMSGSGTKVELQGICVLGVR